MVVPYEVAVSTIQSMFFDIDRDVICSVLEANSGHMEKTVECLLSMSGVLPNEEAQVLDNTIQSQQQVQEDAQYAKKLQDQLYMNQLRLNPEFTDIFGAPRLWRNPEFEEDLFDGPDITEKLKQFGEAAKLKFKEFAMKFKKDWKSKL